MSTMVMEAATLPQVYECTTDSKTVKEVVRQLNEKLRRFDKLYVPSDSATAQVSREFMNIEGIPNDAALQRGVEAYIASTPENSLFRRIHQVNVRPIFKGFVEVTCRVNPPSAIPTNRS